MRRMLSFLSFVCCLWAQQSAAGKLSIDLSAGAAGVTNEDYEVGLALDNAVALRQSGFAFRLGGMYLDDMMLEDEDENEPYINVRGVYLGIGKEIKIDEVTLELGAGALLSETRAYFNEREVSDDDDTSPFVNAKLTIDINKILAIQTDWKYIQDVSGGNISTLQAGVRLTF